MLAVGMGQRHSPGKQAAAATRRFVVASVVLAAWVAVVGPWPIPRGEPPFAETAAGREGVARARAAARAVQDEVARSAVQGIEAGFGKREIVPPAGTTLAGYGRRARAVAHEGIHDPCAARAIALRGRGNGEVALVLGADLLFVNALLRERVLERLAADPGIPRERVFFTATHTHSGPGNYAGTLAEGFAIGFAREDAVAAIASALAGAARDAVRSLAPLEVRVARGRAPALVKNRFFRPGEPGAAVANAALDVVAFERGGAIAGMLVAFGAHATVVGPEPPLLSADYPAGLYRRLEREGAVVLFAASAVGSQAPDAAPFAGRADAFGRALAGEVEALLPRAAPAAGFGLRTVEVPLPDAAVRLAPDYRLSPLLARTQLRDAAPLSILRLGDHIFAGFPAEISGEVAAPLALAALSFSGDYHGYVLPDAYYDLWRYENRLSLRGPGFAAYLAALAAAVAG